MKTKFSKSYIMSNKGCYSKEMIESLSFINKNEITINDFIDSEIPLKDKYWWLIRKCKLTHKECVQIAVDLAEIVLPIYEGKYKSKAPRQAIELTKKWLRGEEVTQQEHNAYVDAYAAAYTAAAYASYATYVDAVYTYAVYTYAAYAASYTASAYAIDAADTNNKYIKQVENYLNKFKI